MGNYIRAEALYRAKIKPYATLEQLSNKEHDLIRQVVIAVIKESYESHGCTLRTYWDTNGEMGNFKTIIYGHKEDPDGHSIEDAIFSDGRTMHWVPTVQIYPTDISYSIAIDMDKIKRSMNKGKNTHTVAELKTIAKSKKLSTTGNKTELAKRILESMK